MDASTFDRWTRLLSRRTFAGALGLVTFVSPGLINARKKRKRRRRKIKRNAFGCVDVGNVCKRDDQCCSGICQGKKDKRKCKGHDAGGCQAGQPEDICDDNAEEILCTASTGGEGACSTTTGGAGYCLVDFGCFPCTKDADCQPFCGPEAACIRCEGFCFNSELTACVGVQECVGLED